MADQFGIIYADVSKAVRRIVVSDDPDYDYSIHAGPGEAHIVADKRAGTDIYSVRAAVETATGEKSPEPLVAIVSKDAVVVGMTLADPALDTIDDHTLVAAYKGVVEGCTYDKPTDTFMVPTRVISAGVDQDGNYVPEKTIEGGPVPKPAK